MNSFRIFKKRSFPKFLSNVSARIHTSENSPRCTTRNIINSLWFFISSSAKPFRNICENASTSLPGNGFHQILPGASPINYPRFFKKSFRSACGNSSGESSRKSRYFCKLFPELFQKFLRKFFQKFFREALRKILPERNVDIFPKVLGMPKKKFLRMQQFFCNFSKDPRRIFRIALSRFFPKKSLVDSARSSTESSSRSPS